MSILAQLLKDAKCSLKEKESLLPEIVRIVSFANKSRKEGLLALEENIPKIKNEIFRENLQLILDGSDPVIVENIMIASIIGKNFKGIQLLLHLIILIGVLRIQRGDNPRIMIREFTALLEPHRKKLLPKLEKLLPKERIFSIIPDLIASRLESISIIKNWISKQKIKKFEGDGFIESFVELSNPFSFNQIIYNHTPLLYFVFILPILETKLVDKILYNLTAGVLNKIVEFIQGECIKPVKTNLAYTKLSESWKSPNLLIPVELRIKYNL